MILSVRPIRPPLEFDFQPSTQTLNLKPQTHFSFVHPPNLGPYLQGLHVSGSLAKALVQWFVREFFMIPPHSLQTPRAFKR